MLCLNKIPYFGKLQHGIINNLAHRSA